METLFLIAFVTTLLNWMNARFACLANYCVPTKQCAVLSVLTSHAIPYLTSEQSLWMAFQWRESDKNKWEFRFPLAIYSLLAYIPQQNPIFALNFRLVSILNFILCCLGDYHKRNHSKTILKLHLDINRHSQGGSSFI